MSLIRICKKGQNKARSAISPPLLPLNSGAHGSLAIYQTVSRRGILRSSLARSCIERPSKTTRTASATPHAIRVFSETPSTHSSEYGLEERPVTGLVRYELRDK